jgi:uncharacterized 2Fe-2S/4Fe-4S cluster protein (DUF4445 family)
MKIQLHGRGAGRGDVLVCEARAGETVLSALARAGLALSAPCGGRGLCGKCKIRLLRGRLKDPPEADGIFLACRGTPDSDIVVEFLSQEEVLENELGTESRAEVSSPVSQAFVPPSGRTGVALDIGTTTVSAQLIDLDRAAPIGVRSELNNQRVFGADVMSRINAAKNGKTGELFALINHQIEGLLQYFITTYHLPGIEKLTVSGNTTMLHLFMNVDPSGMGEVPFTPVFLEQKELSGKELSLSAEQVLLLPSISAFVGGDIVSGLTALDILKEGEASLLIDIGTNGEMALYHGGRLFCCSTAAGPAFEGAEISCGMGSVAGAINKVSEEGGEVLFTTIGSEAPRGICGCGLIDAVALMRGRGTIDETGAFSDETMEGFRITGNISIINRDIRQFQLAKSAIMSGIKILCKNAGLALDEIKNVFIAGGFGFFIDQENAVKTGLLPREFLGRIYVCGNLSLKGAAKCLTDKAFLSSCAGILAKSEVTDLAADPAFMDEFAENMLFE